MGSENMSKKKGLLIITLSILLASCSAKGNTGSHIDNLNRILIHEEEKRRQVYKEKYAKPKPWIEKYPQKTEFGDYAQLLFQDCCGSWSK